MVWKQIIYTYSLRGSGFSANAWIKKIEKPKIRLVLPHDVFYEYHSIVRFREKSTHMFKEL